VATPAVRQLLWLAIALIAALALIVVVSILLGAPEAHGQSNWS
jgi:uncharacterized membrane protein